MPPAEATQTPTKTPPAEPIPAGQPSTPPAAPEPDQPSQQQPTLNMPKAEIKDVTVEGYTFKLNTALLDDVELLEMIDAIESQERPGVIISLLRSLIGEDGYVAMKTYFVKKDGRFKMSTLMKVYDAIFEDFDPKG